MTKRMVQLLSEESAERWFRNQPWQHTLTTSARACLAALPIYANHVSVERHTKEEDNLFLFLEALIKTVTLLARPGQDHVVSIEAAIHRAWAIDGLAASDLVKEAYSILGSILDNHPIDAARKGREILENIAAAYSFQFEFEVRAEDLEEGIDLLLVRVERDANQFEAGGSLSSVLDAPLWRGLTPPDTIIAAQTQLNRFFDSELSIWSFWREWYQGFLDGKPLDWELQRRVALIPDEDWEKGPGRIAEKIAEIKARFLAEKAPLAETVEFNDDTAKFHTVPREFAKPDLLSATLAQVEDALDDVLARPGNGLDERSREVRVIRRVLTRYANDPQQIELNLVSVAVGLRRQMEETRDLPESEENLALKAAVEDGALAIRATHPDVAENREILAQQALRELPQADKEALRDALPVLTAISEGTMQEDFADDVPELINDAIGPVPRTAPPLPGVTRTFGRAAEMRKQLTVKGRLEKIVASPAFLAATVITTTAGLFGVISKLVEIGLRVFGVL